MDYEFLVLWVALFVFLGIPALVLGYVFATCRNIKPGDDMDYIGSMDVDQRLKRFKDQ